ncbi:MAG: prepilin-type N-terminal cleavage/methylation domain-containing protein [Candidatus Acidiferrales bacterium]
MPGDAGFSLIEMVVVVALIIVVSAMALIQMRPIMADADMDTAMRQVIDQIRQAREYSITNRRYVKVAFPTATVGTSTRYEVVTTQMNSLTSGAGTTNPILSTVIIEAPAQYYSFGGLDTPDAYGNSAAIEFEGVSGGPVGGMLFESDGELVDGSTYQPINGTVFLGVPGSNTSARAITVLGATGRARGWKGTGTTWVQF